MPDFNNVNYDQFFHITRGAELVVLKDRDVMAFWADTLPKNSTSGMQMWRDEAMTFQQYGSSPLQSVMVSQRSLLWCRLSGMDIVSGPRWVPYINDDNPDAMDIRPLREVFDPRVTYDRTSNTLHLWFWTNVNFTYDGIQYDENLLYPIGCQEYQNLVYKTGSSTNPPAKRVLCYAIGSLYHAYVKGGYITGFQGMQGTGFDNTTWDLVPVFTRPKLINYRAAWNGPQANGIVSDGWYSAGGAGGYRVQVNALHPLSPVGTGVCYVYSGSVFEGPQGFDGPATETNVTILVSQLANDETLRGGFRSATASKKTTEWYGTAGPVTGIVYYVDVPRLL